MTHSQTLVTAYFDLIRRGQNVRRSRSFFEQHAMYVLQLDAPLVVYVDPELVDWVWKVRGRQRESITRVESIPFESLSTYENYLPRLAQLPAFENADLVKDTPMYQIVNLAKFEYLERAMDENPFATTHFAWVDIAVTHIAKVPEVFPGPVDGVSVLTMRPVAPDEIANRSAFYSNERGRVAGGLMRGSEARFRRLIDAFWPELDQAIASGWRVNEQQVLSYLSCVSPDLFESYVGDYSSTLVNTQLIHDGFDVVLLYLSHCREHGLWSLTAPVNDVIERSLLAGTIELSSEQHARWLDEFLIAAAQAGDLAQTAAIAEELLGYAGTEYFTAEHDRIMVNVRRALA